MTLNIHNPSPMLSPLRALLQLENATIAAVAIAVYAQTGTGWGVFAAAFLLPDLAMLGYLCGPRAGSGCYNAAHTYAAPAMLAACSLAGSSWALPAAIIWTAHIAVDRAIGYGLKYATHFKDTHLGRL